MFIDPTAMIANSINNLFSAQQQAYLQQSQMQAQAQSQQLAAYQQSQQMNTLGNLYGLQQSAGQMQTLQSYSAPPSISNGYARARAEFYADNGDRLIQRLDFLAEWLATPILGYFAKRTAARLATALDATTDEVERWLKMAEPTT